MKKVIVIVTAILAMATGAVCLADVPHVITYQGRLLDSLEAPVSGEFQMTFTIYDLPEGGVALWTSGPQTVLAEEGLFGYDLGMISPIPDSVFHQHFERWLGISVDGGPEMLPRTIFSSVAFAFRAQMADFSGVSEMAGEAEHAMSADTSVHAFGADHASDADHALYTDTAAYAHASPGGGLSLPYHADLTSANPAFMIENLGVGNALRGHSTGDDGVVGWTGVSERSGIYGYSSVGVGVSGRAEGDNHGVYGESNSSTTAYAGVRGYNLGSGPGVSAFGSDIGLQAGCGPSGVAGIFDGDVQTNGKMNVSSESGTPGWFTADSLGISDTGIVYASYYGKGMGTLPAAIVGISHTSDTLGIGGYFEGDYIGLMAQIHQDEDMADRIGIWSWLNGGTYACRNTGMRSEAIGTGNDVNWGLDVLAEGGAFNYGAMIKANEDFHGLYPAITNVGAYLEAGYADTNIVLDLYSNISDSITYGIRSQTYNAPFGYGGHFTVAANDTNYGLYADVSGGDKNIAIYGTAPLGPLDWAGYFAGDVYISGTLYGGKSATKIDHPLDPENKYLVHSTVGSPDMMNIYNGNVTTDENGRAMVVLPDYFEALNTDFRYQLTVIGEFAEAIISEEIRNNQFGILTDKPYIKVSWQVTGIRNDVSAQAQNVPIEMDKPDPERGTYLDPTVFGLGDEFGVSYQDHPRRSDDREISPIERRHDLQGRRERSER